MNISVELSAKDLNKAISEYLQGIVMESMAVKEITLRISSSTPSVEAVLTDENSEDPTAFTVIVD